MPNTLRVAQANLNMDPDYDANAPMTEVQAAELRALCEKLDEPFDTALNQRQAMERIGALQDQLDG
ncbi:DUF3072 domain-containing protein [Pseudooctadecabacter jejudonensis]|uniref:DUF3072 domain-containing protein n=1 Tax=Pseudooctadecabacter jejudonensis TaxID=1391910 RepID=A0A1Y5SM36_9RHOB|nr:DUF3072 domain-containing protein [Pseudooctadecabacter jejudonensis]SLN42746.1 hypothetical protein PSJ8397_02169 [Pseudooctadecabacter jejudonensis]